MNILIPDSWLREYLKTKETPKQIAQYLSLCSQSVEKITKVGQDWVYEIEVTVNRPDCLSVLGIAREAAAILPQFGVKARFVPPKLKKPTKPRKQLPVTIKTDPELCRRVLGIVLDQVKIKPTPKFIRERLAATGVRSLNNLIDITNYVMLEIGHPTHAFDYHRIKTHQLIIRRAKKGEKFVSLEDKKYALLDGDSVIDDSTGRIIDLPGIIGGQNSVVTPETKTVLFFIENNDPAQMRRTSMALGIETMAAAFNEKGLDPELAKTALLRGIELYQKYAEAKVSSEIIDVYPQVFKPKKVNVSFSLIKEQLGVPIKKRKAEKILQSLGFDLIKKNNQAITVQVPSWRTSDIAIPEDLVEEVARIYGYHRLPTLLPTGEFPEPISNPSFIWEEKIKDMLKGWGFSEIYQYSMQGEELIQETGLDPKKCLQLKNPLTRDLEYMRTSLIPSLLQAITVNQSQFEKMKIFEMANIYLPRKNDLPEEKLILVGGITGRHQFYQAKGIIETLLEELGITNYELKIMGHDIKPWDPTRTALINHNKELIGVIGEISPQILANFEIKKGVTVFNLDVQKVCQLATTVRTYKPIPQYPAIVEDLCFIIEPQTRVEDLIQLIKQTSSIIQTVELIDRFNQQRTFRITYQHPQRTLTEKEVQKIRKKIINTARKKFAVQLKTG